MSSRLIFLLGTFILAWVLAFNSGHDLAFSLAYLLTIILLISYGWAKLSLRSVYLRRFTRTQRSQVGQHAEETFEVRNRSIWPKLWLEIEDYSNLPWHEASRVVSSLRRQSSERWQIRTPCTERGRFRLGPMVLRSGDPLGIFHEEQELTATGMIVVYPLVVDLSAFDPSVSELSGGEARRQRTYQVTTNVATIRDYAPGDSFNRIHWPSTARARRLMAKEFELDPTADIWLYIDLYEGAQFRMDWMPTPPEMALFALTARARRNNGAESRVDLPPISTEYVVSAAASLARYFLLRDRAVGMSSYGRTREFLQTDRGERQMNKMLEALAVVEGKGSLPFAHLIATDSVRLNRNDTILAVSADPDPAWAVALQDSQRRGVNSIAIVVDGNTFGGHADYNELYAKFEASGIPYYKVSCDVPLETSLSQDARISSRPMMR
ncbi:MAG: DUF58 domain-containing protein [Caldilineaceae bacterium]|nr:DUF58 domain-containing protein [Caldilineaceae bacterium]